MIPVIMDPRFEKFRLHPTNSCWWCGAPATTREHKFKRSDLQRAPVAEDKDSPHGLHKGSDAYTGALKSIKRGSAVQWSRSMCAPCNGAKSQPLDQAYDTLSDYLWTHQDELRQRTNLSMSEVFGFDWRPAAINSARYLCKQLACALSSERMPLPPGLVDFLNGNTLCANITVDIFKDRALCDLHDLGRWDKIDVRGYWLAGILLYLSQDLSEINGAQYTYFVGFVGLRVTWLKGSTTASYCENETITMPTIGPPLEPNPLAS